jgi:hypothetical protein
LFYELALTYIYFYADFSATKGGSRGSGETSSLLSFLVSLVVVVLVATLIGAALIKYRSGIADIFNQSKPTIINLPSTKKMRTVIQIKDFRYMYTVYTETLY